MGKTSIEWTDMTWSPLRVRVREDAAQIAKAKGYTSLVQIAEKMAGHVGPHCEHVSPGCKKCYAETGNHRCLPANGTGLPFDRRSRDLVESFIDEHILAQPLHWKKPRRIFVENQSDLFGEWVPDHDICKVLIVSAAADRHTLQILTKRPKRMLKIVTRLWGTCPPKNVWLGVSAEDQKTADERIPLLLQTPAAVRFVSYEPALGPVDFDSFFYNPSRTAVYEIPRIDWVIVGGESGPVARPFDIEWARNTIAQCKSGGVACFVKQLGYNTVDSRGIFPGDWPLPVSFSPHTGRVALKDRKGGNWEEWPKDLRVREFPPTQTTRP